MADLTYPDWLERADRLRLVTVHHIDGDDHAGTAGTFTVTAPRDGTPLAEVARAGAA
ncbi:aldehyde dehydrogenase PuuC, partial [Streptomyces sp. SID3343]|nr:aldehyde dehydrogenase PuuC [Streptomyces sp. SID3343]